MDLNSPNLETSDHLSSSINTRELAECPGFRCSSSRSIPGDAFFGMTPVLHDHEEQFWRFGGVDYKKVLSHSANNKLPELG